MTIMSNHYIGILRGIYSLIYSLVLFLKFHEGLSEYFYIARISDGLV